MKIMIDAGHGYETAGKRTVDGMKEYEFNRAVANKMKKLFTDYEHVTVLFPHSDHRDVPLVTRTTKANQGKVDLFVSIHANAHGDGSSWTSAAGIETFVYETKPKSAYELAKIVQKSLIAHTARIDRGVKLANFHVLKATKMTAILCECGFMTNKHEAHLLRMDEYRHTCAKAIVEGIATYYQLVKKKSSEPPAATKELFKVQVGAFKQKENAQMLASDLQRQGYEAIIAPSQA